MQFTIKKYINCPQCGDALPLYFSYAKIAQCDSCKSTIFIEDEAVRLAGESSVLSDEVSLIKLNTPFFYEAKSYLPIGMIRYSYGRGFWEEWWLDDNLGGSLWLSVDEGDMVLEKLVDSKYEPSIFDSAKVGDMIEAGWMISEIGDAVCDGFVGSLPHIVTKGSSYKYIHLSGANARLQTLELIDSTVYTYSGKWINSYNIKKIV